LIRGGHIEEESSFRQDNIPHLGFFRELKSANVFRSPLTLQGKPGAFSRSGRRSSRGWSPCFYLDHISTRSGERRRLQSVPSMLRSPLRSGWPNRYPHPMKPPTQLVMSFTHRETGTTIAELSTDSWRLGGDSLTQLPSHSSTSFVQIDLPNAADLQELLSPVGEKKRVSQYVRTPFTRIILRPAS
jgi:hypothetical protein